MGAQQSSVAMPEDARFAVSTASATLHGSTNDAPILSHFQLESCLGPGSGRMMRTFRVRWSSTNTASHNSNNNNNNNNNLPNQANTSSSGTRNLRTTTSATVSTSTVGSSVTTTTTGTITTVPGRGTVTNATPVFVLKTGWVPADTDLTAARAELERIRRLCHVDRNPKSKTNLHRDKALSHLMPFTAWWVGDIVMTTTTSHPPISAKVRPVSLVRPHMYTTLADRLATRPWLHTAEKIFILYQLLQAVQAMHRIGVVHGNLTTENVGLSSTGWVLVTDWASATKAKTALPDDDPAEYLYYFAPQQQQQHGSISGSGSNTLGGGGVPLSTTTSTMTTTSQMGNDTSSDTTTTRIRAFRSDTRCTLAPERFCKRSDLLTIAKATAITTSVGMTSTNNPTTPPVSGSTTTSNTSTMSATSTNNYAKPPSTTTTATATATTTSSSSPLEPPLTPAMDMFSLGCLLAELFLNGDAAWDLGTLMEYRRQQQPHPITTTTTTAIGEPVEAVLPASVQQKLNKLESLELVTACKQMMQLDPLKRGTAEQYLQQWQEQGQFPSSMPLLYDLIQHSTTGDSNLQTRCDPVEDLPNLSCPVIMTPDGRVALAARCYRKVLWETVGVRDIVGESYFQKVLGANDGGVVVMTPPNQFDGNGVVNKVNLLASPSPTDVRERTLFQETEALLRMLEFLNFEEGLHDNLDAGLSLADVADDYPKQELRIDRTPLCQSTLLIYLQMILATVRHVQRPASKIVALQLMQRLAQFGSDEARLQRIVPVAISLLHDSDPLVRSVGIQVLTKTVSLIESFPPSDSKVFPQYIFKRITHMISDPCLVVRLAFARCIAVLAETAQRFLDISHAVRLYEAVGSATASTNTGTATPTTGISGDDCLGQATSRAVFGDEVTRLLDATTKVEATLSLDSSKADRINAGAMAGKTLIRNTYTKEVAVLQETISRWVVHLTTDQSERASMPKRALLSDLGRLCTFFGYEGVMSFLLPQILAFLNDRKDWELRGALFDQLHAVCQLIGRAATEEYVLPCVESGLVDGEERVISRALACLTRLAELHLVSRSSILGNPSPDVHTASTSSRSNYSFVRKYGVLLLHPSRDVRQSAIQAFSALCRGIGAADCDIYVTPSLSPLLRFHPRPTLLQDMNGMERCLRPPWPRAKYNYQLQLLGDGMTSTGGAWMAIGITATDDNIEVSDTLPDQDKRLVQRAVVQHTNDEDPTSMRVREFLQMLVRHTALAPSMDRSPGNRPFGIPGGIEGSVKLAQSIVFPRHDAVSGAGTEFLPSWYGNLRDIVVRENLIATETSAIRSAAHLAQVYGLSILGATDGIVDSTPLQVSDAESTDGDLPCGSISIEAALGGQWGPEVSLNSEEADAAILLTKLRGLDVPPLPLMISNPEPSAPLQNHFQNRRLGKDSGVSVSWKPRMNAMLATSSPIAGHTAPVVRLSITKDNSFFVSASHDGTCRVWEVPEAEDSVGILDSCVTYSGHIQDQHTRVNDVAMLEGGHSIVSGASDGGVHVWRVDMVSTSTTSALSQGEPKHRQDRARVSGTSQVRKVDTNEGEVLAVSHFNAVSASVITFASQSGSIHSWDLRCAREPFQLKHSAELGYISSMALGNDRHWVVSGSSRGYLCLWDIRFQQAVKLWRHSRGEPIRRLATSYVPSPQNWGSTAHVARPFIFVAAGNNECAMFDALSGSCRETFRTICGDARNMNGHIEGPPLLESLPFASKDQSNEVRPATKLPTYTGKIHGGSINSMVGSIGASDLSYLITGGSDAKIRFWDFSVPSRCYIICGQSALQPRPTFERLDFEGQQRLMLCRQSQSPNFRDIHKLPRKLFHGLKKPEHFHSDSIEDLKIIEARALISCSRDCTVKLWR